MRLGLIALLAALVFAAPARASVRPGWAPTGSMAVTHAWHGAVLLDNGKVLVAGGDQPGIAGTRNVELYDPATGTWSPAGSMVVARTSFSMVKLASGKVLAAGGYNQVTGALSTAELYDPATNSWVQTGPLTAGRNRATLTALPNGKALIAGGQDNSAYNASADLFEPSNNSWSAAGTFADARIDHSATLLADGRVLIAGGFSGSAIYASASVYSPLTNTWASTTPLGAPRSLFGLTLLPNGKVLASGGDNSTGRLSSAELLTAGGAGTPAASMAAIHYQHTATGLGNGKVLAVAGYDGPALGATAELYDSATNSWAPAGTLATPRQHQTATLLADGRVLIAGGYANGGPTATAEVWTPTTTLTADPVVAFGDQTTGTPGGGAVQITNTGDSPLLLDSFSLGGAQPGEFAVNAGRCGVVAPAATCVVDVSFTPAAAGLRSATLAFAANTATGTHAVSLGGRGVAPAPPPPVVLGRINIALSYDYSSAGKRSTRFTRLVVLRVPAGATVTATCAKGCARKRYVKANARGTVSLKPMIKKAVKAGSAIRVVVSQTGKIGAVKTLTVRPRKRPTLTTRCLPPGAKSPQRC